MSSKVRLGPAGVCPDCGESTEVRIATILSSPKTRPWEVPGDVLKSIYRGLVKSYKHRSNGALSRKRFTCTKCKSVSAKLHWIEAVEGGVTGPYCRRCLLNKLQKFTGERELRWEIPIYVVPGRKSILNAAKAALLLSPPSQDKVPVPPSDDEVVLF